MDASFTDSPTERKAWTFAWLSMGVEEHCPRARYVLPPAPGDRSVQTSPARISLPDADWLSRLPLPQSDGPSLRFPGRLHPFSQGLREDDHRTYRTRNDASEGAISLRRAAPG